jgi:hypothetical protein
MLPLNNFFWAFLSQRRRGTWTVLPHLVAEDPTVPKPAWIPRHPLAGWVQEAGLPFCTWRVPQAWSVEPGKVLRLAFVFLNVVNLTAQCVLLPLFKCGLPLPAGDLEGLPISCGRGPTSPAACLDPQTPRLGAGGRRAVWHLVGPTPRACRARGSSQVGISHACIQTTLVRIHGKKCCLFGCSNACITCTWECHQTDSKTIYKFVVAWPQTKNGHQGLECHEGQTVKICCILCKKSDQPVILQLRSHIASQRRWRNGRMACHGIWQRHKLMTKCQKHT